MSPEALRDKALAELEQAGARGISWGHLDHDNQHASMAVLRKLKSEGLVFSCDSRRNQGKSKAKKWFATAALRDAYITAEARKMVDFVSIHRGRPLSGIGFKENASVVWPDHVKIQVCPGVKLRYATTTHDGEVLE